MSQAGSHLFRGIQAENLNPFDRQLLPSGGFSQASKAATTQDNKG